MKVVTVVGARPQFIKAAAVARAFGEAGVDEVIVHTGQHYDENMSASFFEELEIPEPKVNLQVGSGGHGVQTGRMMEQLEGVFLDERPDWVLVYGDTNSTMAGALVASKLHIPIAHVEAGLRSFDRKMPEEVNRVVTDHVSTLLFAPTQVAVDNLAKEGVIGDKVIVSGDVMYDVAVYFADKAQRTSTILNRLGLEAKQFALSTIHRAENTDEKERLDTILEGLSEVAKTLPVVLPLHPRTAAALERHGLLEKAGSSLRLIDPLGYLDMLFLLRAAAVVATDSGGVQKEAFFQSTPCVTLRFTTEWVELVESGWNQLVPPTGATEIATAVRGAVGQIGREMKAYGSGDAARVIVESLKAFRTSGM